MSAGQSVEMSVKKIEEIKSGMLGKKKKKEQNRIK